MYFIFCVNLSTWVFYVALFILTDLVFTLDLDLCLDLDLDFRLDFDLDLRLDLDLALFFLERDLDRDRIRRGFFKWIAQRYGFFNGESMRERKEREIRKRGFGF